MVDVPPDKTEHIVYCTGPADLLLITPSQQFVIKVNKIQVIRELVDKLVGIVGEDAEEY